MFFLIPWFWHDGDEAGPPPPVVDGSEQITFITGIAYASNLSRIG